MVSPQKVDLTGPFDADAEEPRPKPVEVERRFGPYVLCYQISHGGMGTVYLARLEDPGGFSRPVALKRIHEHLAEERPFVEMFLDEAFIASKIKHPNVCSILDVGQVDRVLYIAMEYLAGVPLARLSRAVSLDTRLHRSPTWHTLAARIVADAAEGLHATHELTDDNGVNLGTVHRDVSPQNVFITFDGHVKLIDFGIVFAKKRFHHTQRRTLKGKVSYMAPEQLRGGRELDRRVDVWSLGVCFWEMLAGRRLFKETESLQTLDALLDDKLRIPPPSQYCATIPQALDDIVLHALTRDRKQRFDTALVLSQELRQYVARAIQPSGAGELAALLMQLFSVLHSEKSDIVKTILTSAEEDLPPENSPRSSDQPGNNASDSGKVEILVQRQQQDLVQTLPDVIGPTNKARRWQSTPPPHPEELSDIRTNPSVDAIQPKKSLFTRHQKLLLFALALAVVFVFGFIAAILVMEGQRIATPTPQENGEVLIDQLIDRHRSIPPTVAGIPPTAAIPTTVSAVESPDSGAEEPPPSETTNQGSVDETPQTETTDQGSVDGAPQTEATSNLNGEVEASQLETADAGQPLKTPPRNRNGNRRPTKTRHRPTAQGQVNVVALGGWADVYEGSRSLGRTPRQIVLSEGPHTLTLRPFGREKAKRIVVDVLPNETIRVVVPVGD